jgi:hypothetical protein
LATDAKSNEITAIPKLLAMLAIKGRIVTIEPHTGCGSTRDGQTDARALLDSETATGVAVIAVKSAISDYRSPPHGRGSTMCAPMSGVTYLDTGQHNAAIGTVINHSATGLPTPPRFSARRAP